MRQPSSTVRANPCEARVSRLSLVHTIHTPVVEAANSKAPSGRVLARTMARYVEPELPGPVVELGPGTGPVTEALVDHGVDPARLVLVEFNPTFCQLLRARFPAATVIQPHSPPSAPTTSPGSCPLRTRLRMISGQASIYSGPCYQR